SCSVVMRLFVARLRYSKSLAWHLRRIFALTQGASCNFAGYGNTSSRLYVKHPFFATCGRSLGIGALMLLGGCTMEVLSPKGDIGAQEKTLILTALGLMLLVVVPVIIMTL